MLKQGCRIVAREPTATPGRSRTTGFSRHLPQDLVNDQLGRLALFCLIGMVLWTAGLLIDQLVILTDPALFEIAGGQAPRPRGGRHHRLGRDVPVRALFATHARDEDEYQPHLSAPQCGSHRRVEHMGGAAAHAGRDRRRVVDRDSAAHLFNGCRRQSRQDAGSGACGSVVRSPRRLACASARRAGAVVHSRRS